MSGIIHPRGHEIDPENLEPLAPEPAPNMRKVAARKIHRCDICGRFTDRNGKCPKVYTVEPGIYEHD